MNKHPMSPSLSQWLCSPMFVEDALITGADSLQLPLAQAPWQGPATFEPLMKKCPVLVKKLEDWLTAPLAFLDLSPQLPSPGL